MFETHTTAKYVALLFPCSRSNKGTQLNNLLEDIYLDLRRNGIEILTVAGDRGFDRCDSYDSIHDRNIHYTEYLDDLDEQYNMFDEYNRYNDQIEETYSDHSSNHQDNQLWDSVYSDEPLYDIIKEHFCRYEKPALIITNKYGSLIEEDACDILLDLSSMYDIDRIAQMFASNLEDGDDYNSE